MKKLHEWALGAVMMLLALVSCQNEEFVSDAPQETVPENSSACILSAKDFRWQEAESRSSLTVGENDFTSFSWTVGDKVGILPNQGAQVFFEIPEPEEGEEVGKTAKFDGGAWALKSESNYAAYYPFVKDFDLDRTEVPVTYTGQKQVGNSNSAHLGAYDYMGALPVQTNVNGGVCFDFDHVGALVFVRFTVPAANTQLKSVSLSAADVEFTTEGTYNLTLEGFPITPTTQADALTVDVEYTTRSANEEVTVYLMAAPVNLSGKTVNISVAYEEDSETKAINYTCQGKNLEAANVYLLEAVAEIPYLTFSSSVPQTLSLMLYTFDDDMNFIKTDTPLGNVQYSINGGEWQSLNNGQTEPFGGNNGNLRLRGKCPNGTVNFAEYEFAVIEFSDKDNDVACLGDIRTLVDYEQYYEDITDEARFCYLFSGCSSLTSAPELPATTLADYCYMGMFSGCSSLTSAPELPATTLTESCYESMFSGCSSLTLAPELPATTLAGYCYSGMFSGCSSLTSAPELSATTLAEYCYSGMFSGCSSLTLAPELPATSLQWSCYLGMFSGCSSLTSAPELPATSLQSSCYMGMFSGCTSLASAPALPATTLAESCYSAMFEGCTSLTSAPKLPVITLASYCYSKMFKGCSSLTLAPELPASTLASYCYQWMFNGCTRLNSVTMLATDISATSCLLGWLDGVASSGILYRNPEMSDDKLEGYSPSGWTSQDYVAPAQGN